MSPLLILGFILIAGTGVLFRYRGRRTAGLGLAGAALVGLAISVAFAGREGLGEFALGSVVGLPVLIGGVVSRSRAEKRASGGSAPMGTG